MNVQFAQVFPSPLLLGLHPLSSAIRATSLLVQPFVMIFRAWDS